MRDSEHGADSRRPPWWPDGEHWPPQSGRGAQAWGGFGRRLARFALIWFALVIAVPLLIGVVLAATIGGWTSVVVAVVSWVGLAVVVGLGLRVGLRSWQPVRSLIETAGRLADGDYSARVDHDGGAPVRPVVDSFNRMADRLESTERERRRLLADVGHEIRTPLTIIRGELEAMADGVREPDEDQLRRLLNDVDVVERLLEDLATLSTAEAGALTIHAEAIDLVALVRAAVSDLQPEAQRAHVSLNIHSPVEQLEGLVDPIRVREITTNLVTNAIRATPEGGSVDVSVDTKGTAAAIVVSDNGEGLSPGEVERVFDRFHKGPNSGGSGLGLTISRNLARAHGGDITLVSEEGAGTTVTVELPLTPDETRKTL